MTAATIDRIRPTWWRIAVAIADVIIPSIGTAYLFVDPIGFPFDEKYTDIFSGENNELFKLQVMDNLRGEACGNVVAIVLAILTITTTSVDMLRDYSRILMVFLGLLFLYMMLMWIKSGFTYLDTFGFTMDTTMLLLQIYIQWSIKKHQDSASNNYTNIDDVGP
mmetsp:Transcript_47348/g.115560  ORF Transcript_47348/g.115560 Transcript_47348/m.115560 type:complete len:164 (+) Transcript_47348:152-643(+)|eukprot:CAMPEP_0113474428 /NCGR_PEP_ID=MMETSP0014_2-20120614/18577_1 /TAXON_ID=2857 /ORGANISM="Nitzschia sp." /LENGTH=163 /DNA_ID=CAMNT_0000367271 /DNA_START=101 /DNA_END=592 /DNA_ORIENTATION=+ /assembly_acc=CAM_ASM_000159